jgi:hypothetical protein
MPVLSQYTLILQNLIQSPTSPVPLLPSSLLDTYINIARQQLAGDGECIRLFGTLMMSSGISNYTLAAIVPNPFGTSGVDGVLAVRMANQGGRLLDLRPWEWFFNYYYAQPATSGMPMVVAQQGQGLSGTLWFWPPPDPMHAALGVNFDCVCLPIPLVDDTTPDAIPYPWSDAVPFYAAYYAYMAMQRQADADMMLARYLMLMRRARGESVPSALPENLPGDMGARMAASKTSMTQTVQQMQRPAARGAGG